MVSGLLSEVGEAREVLGFWRGLGRLGRQGAVPRASLTSNFHPLRGLAGLSRGSGKPHSRAWPGAGVGSSGEYQRAPGDQSRPRPSHLHLPHILVPLALHAPQLRHALLQVGSSVAVLDLIVLAAVLGEGAGGGRPTSRALDSWPMGQSAGQGRRLGWERVCPGAGHCPALVPSVRREEAAARLTLMNCMSSLVFFSMCCSRSPWNVCTCVEGSGWSGGPSPLRPQHPLHCPRRPLPTQC